MSEEIDATMQPEGQAFEVLEAKRLKAINIEYFKKAIILLAELGYSTGYITEKARDAIVNALS
jgi:hypothetical protein